MKQETLMLLLADVVLATHILVVVFVVFGLVMILIGGALGWHWVRGKWFRSLHLACIGIVMIQAWMGVRCPLTDLEMWLRAQGGGQTYEGSMITYWMQTLLYYDAPAWVFTAVYTAFASLVALSWFWVKPNFKQD